MPLVAALNRIFERPTQSVGAVVVRLEDILVGIGRKSAANVLDRALAELINPGKYLQESAVVVAARIEMKPKQIVAQDRGGPAIKRRHVVAQFVAAASPVV
jgi:hypothetical protein